jgi:hypothetical protein
LGAATDAAHLLAHTQEALIASVSERGQWLGHASQRTGA